MIEALAPAGLELVEEPVHGLAALRAVRERVAVRIAMDETTAEPGALASGAADAVCLKLGRCGGISGLLAAATLVRATGAEPYVASTFDGPLGIAAALHAAAALRHRAGVRAGDARAVRGPRRPAARPRRGHRRADRAGAACDRRSSGGSRARLLRRSPSRHRYGAHPHQVCDLHVPAGAGPHPVVVVLHGGYWQPPYTKLIMRPLCLDLARRGYAAWNVEYRRLGPRRRRLADDVRRRRRGDRPARRPRRRGPRPRRG